MRTSAHTEALIAIEAEARSVAACLLDPEQLPAVRRLVTATDFLDEVARAAFAVMEDLHDRGEPVHVHPLVDALKAQGGHVAERATMFLVEARDRYTTGALATHYARKVAEASRKRKLADAARELGNYATNGKASIDTAAWMLDRAIEFNSAFLAEADPWPVWRTSIDLCDRPAFFQVDDHNSQLARLGIGPGRVTMIGAPPGFGKTLIAMQVAINALSFDETLRALVCNVEMTPAVLLDRQVSRLAKVPYNVVRDRAYAGDRRVAVIEAADDLHTMRDRLHFLSPPFTMPRVRATVASLKADLVLLDYIQRIKPAGATAATDARQQASDAMTDARALAMEGVAVLVISAMSRAGEFRESSELEYGADSAFVMERVEGEDATTQKLIAKCRKNRHGAPLDIELELDGRYQGVVAGREAEEWDIA